MALATLTWELTMVDDQSKLVLDTRGEGIDQVSPEELEVVLRLLSSKLPAVIDALNAGQNGWKQTFVMASYLLAATLNRHPEYAGNVFALLTAFQSFYPVLEAEFAQQNPGLVSELIQKDTVYILLPEQQTHSGE